ncbi:MAG: DUF928 domain-containing protein [Hydrococcus sp. RU_2_2]|nr:DUF928 domain-containing protein [Hydrococcus sp. RU_2_2]NJP21688.1 DUF928 domain-containing protein [Hydrococcus sp. CRU_1_1]
MLEKITIVSLSGLVLASIVSVPGAIGRAATRSVIAQSRITYIPRTPRSEKPPETGASTSRGCPQNLAGLVKPLAPSTHVGLTVSARPTLLFELVKKSPVRVKLVVAAIDGRKPLVEQPLSVDTPGVKKVALPPGVELETNKEYIWSIVLICNRVRPSENPAAQAFIQRVVPDSNLIARLNKASSSQERSFVYAANGIWYDAIAMVQNNKLLLQELINQKEGIKNSPSKR